MPVLGVGYLGALLWGLGIAVAFPLAMSAAGETPGRGPSAIATVATIAYAGLPGRAAADRHASRTASASTTPSGSSSRSAPACFALAGTARDPREVRG